MNLLPMELFAHRTPATLALLEELVNIESPSTDKAAVDRLGQRITSEAHALGGTTEIEASAETGDQLVCRWGSGPGGILVMCHMDTVFDLGTLARNPFRAAQGRLHGPGVLDMKASIAMLLGVMGIFYEQNTWPERPLTAIFTSDEEIGSRTSRLLIEREARQSALVLCLEPALANGAVKTARKGTGNIEIFVQGVAAHAGVDHERGRNAIEELAHHILAAQSLTNYSRGTTVNAGVVHGGTRTNVVPDEAVLEIDFRVAVMDEYRRLEQWANTLSPVIDGTKLQASITLNRPPMPRDETMARSFARLREIGQALGLDLQEGSTGGGSDANFVAPLGIPVLDGLGPLGDGAHSEHEYVEAGSITERAALLAAVLLNW